MKMQENPSLFDMNDQFDHTDARDIWTDDLEISSSLGEFTILQDMCTENI